MMEPKQMALMVSNCRTELMEILHKREVWRLKDHLAKYAQIEDPEMVKRAENASLREMTRIMNEMTASHPGMPYERRMEAKECLIENESKEEKEC